MEVRSKKEEKVLSWGDGPIWSPDGRYIAFIGYGLSKPSIEEEVAMDICLLDLKTRKPRQVTFNGVSSDFAFNPKSSDILAYISCTTSCLKGRVFLYFLKENKSIRLSSREVRTFEANPVQVYDWSPDGRYIAYIDGGELWIAGPFFK